MDANEKAVRDAAAALTTAIDAAEKAGFKVHWPFNAAGLPAIAISATAKAPAPAAAKKPAAQKS